MSSLRIRLLVGTVLAISLSLAVPWLAVSGAEKTSTPLPAKARAVRRNDGRNELERRLPAQLRFEAGNGTSVTPTKSDKLDFRDTFRLVSCNAQSSGDKSRTNAPILFNRFDTKALPGRYIAQLAADGEGEKEIKPDNSERLKNLIDTARQAEASTAVRAPNGEPVDAALAWLAVARQEISDKMYDPAVKHIEHAIDLATPDTNAAMMGLSRDRYCGLLGGDWTIQVLAMAGRSEEAERLYIKTANRAKSMYGVQSAKYNFDLVQLFGFYFKQKQVAKALTVLDEINSFDPRKLEADVVGGTGYPNNVVSIVSDRPNKEQRDFALSVWRIILDLRKKYFAADDFRIADVYCGMAQVETAAENLAEAENYLRKAVAIESLYRNDLTGINRPNAGALLYKLMLQENRTSEAAALHSSTIKEDKAMQRFWYLSHDAKQSRTKEFYDFWHKHAPYSHRCLRASLRLLEQYQKEKLWEKVIAYGSESIKIIDHNSLSPCGGCEPVMPPMKRRLACCKAIAEACINLGKISEAKDWLAQALADRAYKTDADVLFTLAELAAICQEKDLAIELCKQAMSFKSDDLNAEFNTIRAQTIFKKIGDTADANSMAEQSWSFVLRRMSKDRRQYLMQKQETDKLHKANQENSAKPPDSSANQKWKAEPSKALTFPPVQVLNDYSFKYALLASAITIGSGSQVMRSDQQNPMPTYAFAAAWKTIECAQPVHKAGDLYFLYDGPPGSLLTPAEQAAGMQGRQSGGGGLWMAPFTAPPSAQSLPLKAAPDAPAGAATPDLSNADVILKPGDYKAETLTVGSIIIPTSGRVRLFINDKNSMQTPVFRTNAASGINYSMIGPFFFSPSRFELWYNGTGTIRLDNDCLFAGIIYAPNARVEMGDRVRLYGAVVAKEIITGRDCKIMYDLRLNSWNDN